MAKSTTSRKSLKSLFSRGTASASNPDSPAEKDKEKEREKEKEKDVDKNEGGEKKRFKFLKFKTKPKPASNDSQQQQVFSDPELSNTVDVDGEASVENVFPEKKRFSLYGTTPKSKVKELSYSEMDLRKPKKFATFSFGLRKRKKREEGSISKSTFGLDSPGIEEPEEASMVLSPMELDPATTKKRFSMSQPVLDTSDSFDIPSPPPVATNPSGSYFNLPDQSHSSVNIDPQPEAKEPLTNGSTLSDEHKEPRKAPIAAIPELQLDYADSTEEKKNIPVDVKSSKSDSLTHTEAISVVDNQTVPVLTPSQPPIVLDGSDGKAAAVVETVFTRNTETETSLAESTVDSLSYRQQDTPDIAADRAKGEPALSGVDFEIDTTMTQSTPVASSVTTTPAVSGEQGARSESQDEVYGALYDSLFPQNFTTELFSSLLNSPSQINSETRHLNTRSEEVTVQTLNESYSEKNVMYSRLSTSRERDLSLRRMDGHSNINATFNGREGVSSSESSRYTSYRTSSTYNTPASPDIHFKYLPPSFYSGSETTGSDHTKYSEQTSSPSEVKSDRCGLFQDSVRSAAEYATPQGTDTQVTDSIRRVILVKEIVAEGEEEEKEKGCPSTVPEKHSSTNGLNSPTESFSSPAVQMDGHEGLQSPAYLSVGSDDGSAMEIYYSAEEDNAEESGDEEMQTMVQTKEVFVVDRVKQDELCEDFPQQVEIAERSTPMFEREELSVIDEVEEVEISEREMSKRDEGLMRVVIVRTQSSVDETEDIGSQGEVQRQLNDSQSSETWTSEFLAGNDAKSEVTEVATMAYPPVKDTELFEEFSEQGEIGERGIANEEREVCVVDEVKRVQLSEEIAQRKITYVEREEVKVVEELKEVEPREEIPEHREIKETEISKRDEGHMRVVIVKMRSVDETEDIDSHTEVQQQINDGQSSSEFLMGFNAKREEDEGANTMFSQVKDTERGLTVVESEAVLVVDTVKEVELPEELPQGLFVKTQRDGGTTDSVEEKEDIGSQTELPDGQSLKTWTSEILTGSGAKASEEKEVATTAFSHVKDAGLREEFLKQDEIADREMTYVEREDVSLADGVKQQVELRSEEFSQHVEMAGAGTSQRDEEELKVEIGQIQREGGAMGSEEEKEDIGSQTEVQQQLNDGPSSEIGIPEFMAGSYAKSEENEEEEEATMAYPQVKDASLIEEISQQGEITEREITYVEKVEVVSVVDKMKDADLSEEFPKQGEIEETGLSKRDEGQSMVLPVKEQDDGGKMSDEEEKEHISKQTEVHQIPDGSEQTGIFELQTGNDAKSEEKATTSFPWVTAGGQVETEVDLQAPPVRQVNTVMVCDLAPPSSEPYGHMREGAEGNQTGGLVTEDPPNGKNELPTSQAIQCVASVDLSSDYIPAAAAASSNSGEEDWITPKLREAEEQVCELREEACKENTDINSCTTAIAVADTSHEVQVVSGILTDRAELESDATEKSCEWVDTIVQSADRTGTPQEQVTVELSIPNADTQHPDTQAADTHSERHQHPSEAQPELNGSLTDSLTPTAASEFGAPENQPIESDQESVDKMNLGYSSLSTKLSINTSSTPKEDEANYRFGKVSLTSEADSTTVTQDSVDFNKTSTTVIDTNGPDLSSSWRNRFEEDSQYKPYTIEESSFTESLSYRMSDTSSRVDEANTYTSTSFLSSSSLPKATAYTHLGDTYSSSLPSTEERITLGNRLTDRTEVYPSSEWRSGLVEREGPAAPAGEREQQREGEAERIESRLDSEQLLQTDLSSPYQYYFDTFKDEGDDSSRFSGLFKATLVELVSDPAAPPSTPPASPAEDSTNQFDMDSLVDTLKSMGPSLRQRSIGQRGPPPSLMSSLPPIVEDAPLPAASEIKAPAASLTSPAKPLTPITSPSKSLTPITSPSKPLTATVELGKPALSPNGLYTLPGDIGLKRTAARDNRSPLELMKQSQQQDQQQPGTKGLTLPLRQSAISSIVMRTSSDSSPDELKSPVLNGNGVGQSSSPNSRLENSVVFGSYRSPSLDKPVENKPPHRPLFRTGSLPDSGPSNDRVNLGHKELGEPATGAEPAGSRFDRFSFLLNSTSNSTTTSTSSSLSGSLTGSEDFNSRLSRAPQLNFNSPTSGNSPKSLLSPASSFDLHKPFTNTTSTDSSLLSRFGQTQGMGMGAGTGAQSSTTLQRSFSSEGTAGLKPTSLFNSVQGGSQFQSQKKEPEPDKNLATKYRAFPDAYLTKTKEHGKLNPRPGKMYIYDRPGMCGQRIDIRSDVHDATSWDLGETISIRVIRGGWVLYELPKFRGEKIALDEGDLELTNPFNPPEEPLQNGQTAEKQNGEAGDGETESKPVRKFVIGSLRRAVRDYSVPEISLFPEENAEGKKVTFRDTSEDARIFGFPIKANSVIVNAGLWLVYAHPFFQGVPRVLEVGGYSTPASWGVEQPYVGSVHPLKIAEPRVENISEPKIEIYDKPYFSGKSRIITTNMRDFISKTDQKQKAFMHKACSIKVHGGIWVGYEKEGFRGHQYLLEEGEYQDWRVWGGCDAELRSLRVIRADLSDPLMVMFEQPEEEHEETAEGNTFEVSEAIPDVELFDYKTSTRSIHVVSGAWVAYSQVDFSGNQFILEKGFYNNCADWGSHDNRICSVQPILQAPSDSSKSKNEVILYADTDFQGAAHVFDRNTEELPEKLLTKSCRVSGGSWVLYDDKKFLGNMYVLFEGDYPNLTSMGCPTGNTIRSVRVVPLTFSVPSISLFGLECQEGREITIDTEIFNMVEEGFNNHILSVRVNSGTWVICEHSNYRGRQFLLEPIEITNWPKFSSIQTVGSMFPVRQKRHYFRIKNKEKGHFMSIQGGVEEMKSGRLVVLPEVEPMTDIWFYQDGLIKSKLAQTMSLQAMGKVEPGSKVVLWSETRQPIQSWAAQTIGLITSLTFPGMVLDLKGGKSYDKDHVVMMPENDERPSQQWEIELL